MRQYDSGSVKEIEPAPKLTTGHARTAAITSAQIKLHKVATLLRSAGLRDLPQRVDAIAVALGKPGQCC